MTWSEWLGWERGLSKPAAVVPPASLKVHVALPKQHGRPLGARVDGPCKKPQCCQAAYGDSQRSAAPHSLRRGRAMRLPGPAGPPAHVRRRRAEPPDSGAWCHRASLSVLRALSRLQWRMTLGISPPRPQAELLDSGGCGGDVLGLWGRSRRTRMARWYGDAPGVPQCSLRVEIAGCRVPA